MVGFRSDNTTGSAWADSGRSFRLPRRSENTESAFLAGNYAKADQRRQLRLSQDTRDRADNQPRTWTAAGTSATPQHTAGYQTPKSRQTSPRYAGTQQPANRTPKQPANYAPSQQPASYAGTRPSTAQGATTTVGRLRGVTVPSNRSSIAKAARGVRNMGNERLANTTATFSGSSGFSLDGVELTKEEYAAWMGGYPDANDFVVIERGNRSDRPQPSNVASAVRRDSRASSGPMQTRSNQPSQRTGDRPGAQGSRRRSTSWIVILFIVLIGSGVIREIGDLIFNVLDGF